MASFVEIPASFLQGIATDSDRIPRLYFCGNTLSSRIFWQRLRFIHRLIDRFATRRESCLDFGGGGGVFLPTLAGSFERVVSVDLETAEAEHVVRHYRLPNVDLVRADATSVSLPQAPFDVIVAADVLEHFRDLAPAVDALERWLAPEGRLFTSLPSETGLYDRLRRLYGVEPPPDHYHTGFEAERYLCSRGFRRLQRWCVPLRVRLAPLYLVSAWRRSAV